MNNNMAGDAAAHQMVQQLRERKQQTGRIVRIVAVVALVVAGLTYVIAAYAPKGDAPAETTDSAQ